MNSMVTFLLHLGHASFALGLETHSYSLLEDLLNGVSYGLTETHKMDILCPSLGLCGREGIHSSAQMFAVMYVTERKNPGCFFVKFTFLPLWYLTVNYWGKL